MKFQNHSINYFISTNLITNGVIDLYNELPEGTSLKLLFTKLLKNKRNIAKKSNEKGILAINQDQQAEVINL